MEFLSLLVFSFAGGIIWLFNEEAAAIAASSAGVLPAWAVALACASGQTLAYVFLFFCGHWLLSRWRWFQRQVDKMMARWGERLGRSFLLLTAPAALVGIPPMTGMAAVARSFNVRLLPLVAIAFSLRLVRLMVLAGAGTQLAGWWEALWRA